MANRNIIINTIGNNYLSENIENGEFSYQKAFKAQNKDFDQIKIKSSKSDNFYKNLDIRFIDDTHKVAILVETKQNFDKGVEIALEQLDAYISYEEQLTGYA